MLPAVSLRYVTVTSAPLDVASPATFFSAPVMIVLSSYRNSISAPAALFTENVRDCGSTCESWPVIDAGSASLRSRS